MKFFALPDIQKKIIANWAKLFTGSSLGSALGLVATILMTRAIGVTDVGIVSVIQTFWRTFEGFLSFQSFQVLIKNGADILHGKSGGSFRALVKICMLADALMALAGAAAGVGGMAFFHARLNIPDSVAPFALFGALTMMTMVTGAHLGFLRLFDRFHIVAARDVVVGALRVAGNGGALLAGASLRAFICIWIVTEAAGNLMLIFYGFRELRARGYTGILAAPLRGDPAIRIGRIVKALFTVNFGTMVRVLSEEGDTLLVNAFAGAASAGIYKIAKNFSGVAYKFTGPLAQSVYPEIARAVSEKNRGKFKSIMLHTGLQGGLFGVGVWLCWFFLGGWVIHLTVGEAYRAALPVVLIITGGYALTFSGLCFNPALYAFNSLRQYLAAAIACTLMYFAVALPLLPALGMKGSAYGQIACSASGFLIAGFAVYRSYCKYKWG